MIRLGCLFLLLCCARIGLAKEVNPEDAKILKCMVVYEYDFVADFLGLTVNLVGDNGGEIPSTAEEMEKKRNEQALQFMQSGRLKFRPGAEGPKSKLKKDIVQRCQILAETVIEVMIVKDYLLNKNEKSGPEKLDQSL